MLRKMLADLRGRAVRFMPQAPERPMLDAFFVSAPAGLVVLDSNLRVVRANTTLAEMVGVTPEKIIGQTPRTLVPQLAPRVEPLLRRVLSTHEPALNAPISGETRVQAGLTRYWKVSVFPLRGTYQQSTCVGAIIVEVAPSVRLEHVKRSESLLAEAECLANVGSWEQDLLTDEGRRSANLCRMLDLNVSETRFADREFWDLVHPDDRERVSSIIREAMGNVQPYQYQARFRLRNGKERVFLTRGRPILDDSKRIIRCVGVTQDITERIEAERALRDSEERYRDLVENSHDLICLHDLDGRLLWMNELPARILGYSRDELIGRRIPEMLEPQLRNDYDEYIAKISRDGRARGLMRVVARSGERRVWEYDNTLRTGSSGAPIIRGMAHDITELKRTEKRLRKQSDAVSGLLATAQCLTQTLELDGIVQCLNWRAMMLLGAESSCVGVRTKQAFSCSSLFEGAYSKTVSFAFPVGAGITGWIVANKRSYLTNDSDDPLISAEFRRVFKIQNELCVPIFDVPKTEVIAFLALFNKADDFDHDDLSTAEGLAEIASIAMQNAFSYRGLRLAEAQLRRLSAQLMSSRDMERKRIAQVLHEETSQDLAGVKILLERLSRDTPLTPSGLEAVIEGADYIERALRSIRNLSHDLHPPLLDLGGLWLAIHSHAERFSRNTGIAVTADLDDNLPRLTPAEEIAIFRIVQECFTNIRIHSESKTARISIRRECEALVVEVSDSGKGFRADIGSPTPGAGLGIMGMKERAREIGAELELASSCPNGTTVRLFLPLKQRKGAGSGEQSEAAAQGS